MTVRQHPLPSQLPDLGAGAIVAVDTETSGLHVDDGARISTVSVAYWTECGLCDGRSVIDDLHPCMACNGEGGVLVGHAWPFDQGPLSDKPGMEKCKDPSLLIEPGSDRDFNLHPDEYDALTEWLSDKQLVFQNAKFDLHMFRTGLRGLEEWTGIDLSEQAFWDCMPASRLLWPVLPTSLDAVCRRLFGEDNGKADEALKAALKQNSRYGVGLTRRYDLVSWEAMEEYARVDTELTLRLQDYQTGEFEEQPHLIRYFDQDIKFMKALYRMEVAALPYSAELSLQTADELDPVLEAQIAKLPFRFTPPAASAWFFTEKGEMPHCISEKTQKPSIGECCVRDLIGRGGEVGQAANDYRVAQKIKNAIAKYYRGFPAQLGRDGRLRTDFKEDGTVSFRISSTRVNMQALPHDYRLDALPEGTRMPRSCFLDEPGCELWEFDLAQAEYRVAGRLAGCERILRYVVEGIDAHSETAVLLFGDAEFQNRQVAKRSNFSLLFSIGRRKFNMDVEKNTGLKLGETKAGQIIDTWRGLHPEIPIANRRAEQAMLARGRAANVPMAQGWVRLMDGRQRWFQWREHSYAAFNQAVQGTIAQGVKAWLLAVDEAYPGMLRLTVHDSIALSIPKDRVEEVTAGVIKIGKDTLTTLCQVTMDVDAKRWKTAGEAS